MDAIAEFPRFNRSCRSRVVLCPLALVALLLGSSQAQAETPWRSVRGSDLPPTFVDHELADGVHYAYLFRADGTFSGMSMGKEIHGTWRATGTEFCWTRLKSKQTEECFEIERRGNEVRLLRDGYEVLSARLSPVKSQAAKEVPR